MGQKTHPIGFRLGIVKTWTSKWYEEKNFAKWLHEDIKLKKFIKKKLEHAGVAGVDVERAANKAKINIYTARPGIVIGKRGAGVEQLKKEVQALTENEVFLNIQEIRKAETNAQLISENIATQLERRVAFRRAMKKAVQTAMKFGAKGIRVSSSGRLGGAEMARYEWYREGRVPLRYTSASFPINQSPKSRPKRAWAKARAATRVGWRWCGLVASCMRLKASTRSWRARRSTWHITSYRYRRA